MPRRKAASPTARAALPPPGTCLTNDTDPDSGDTKAVTAISFGSTTGTLGTALAGAYGSLVITAPQARTPTRSTRRPRPCRRLRQSTNTLTDVFTYTMRDTAGATSTATLTVTVHGANDAPVLAAQTANQNAVVGSAFSLVLPAGTFTDVDTGDTLTYSATLADGSALPSWLTFNPTTRTFSGTPAAANVGTLNIRATATDLGALAASETFTITVGAPSTPPTAVADAADATEKGGVANGLGRIACHQQRPHQRHRSRCGRHQDRHRDQLRLHGRRTRHGSRRWHSAVW